MLSFSGRGPLFSENHAYKVHIFNVEVHIFSKSCVKGLHFQVEVHFFQKTMRKGPHCSGLTVEHLLFQKIMRKRSTFFRLISTFSENHAKKVHIFRLRSTFFRKSRFKGPHFQVKVHFFQKITCKRSTFSGRGPLFSENHA